MNTRQASPLVYQMPYLADVKLFFIAMSNSSFTSFHWHVVICFCWYFFIKWAAPSRIHNRCLFQSFIWLQDIFISNYSTESFVIFFKSFQDDNVLTQLRFHAQIPPWVSCGSLELVCLQLFTQFPENNKNFLNWFYSKSIANINSHKYKLYFYLYDNTNYEQGFNYLFKINESKGSRR